MNRKKILIILFVILAILHQDSWNWENSHAVFGFIPVGLFYHACYSLVAACFWGLVIHFAWPTKLEEWAKEGGDQ